MKSHMGRKIYSYKQYPLKASFMICTEIRWLYPRIIAKCWIIIIIIIIIIIQERNLSSFAPFTIKHLQYYLNK